MSLVPQRPLGHHLFTSFAGQRTVHLSADLHDRMAWLESRAQAAYHAGPGWECLHTDGRWWFTLASANGTDHVGRPRALVHQIAIQDQHLPGIFSPLWLRRAALPRLDSPDPVAISARLAPDLAAIDLRSVMPPPAEFSQLMHAPVRAAAGALLHALRKPGSLVEQEVPGAMAGSDALASVLGVALVHQPPCRISTWRTSLPGPEGNLPVSTVILRDAASTRTSTSETMLGGGFYPSDWILDLIAGSPNPPRLLALLRLVPLPTLLDRPWSREAVRAFSAIADQVDRDGLPAPGRCTPDLANHLADLADAGLAPWVAWLVSQLRDRAMVTGMPTRALQDAILDPTRDRLRAAFTA